MVERIEDGDILFETKRSTSGATIYYRTGEK
jgi:hypothetical protein